MEIEIATEDSSVKSSISNNQLTTLKNVFKGNFELSDSSNNEAAVDVDFQRFEDPNLLSESLSNFHEETFESLQSSKSIDDSFQLSENIQVLDINSAPLTTIQPVNDEVVANWN